MTTAFVTIDDVPRMITDVITLHDGEGAGLATVLVDLPVAPNRWQPVEALVSCEDIRVHPSVVIAAVDALNWADDKRDSVKL